MTSLAGHDPAPAWFDISSPDAAGAHRFYQEMFGGALNVLNESYALVGGMNGQPAGGIGQAGPDSPYTGIMVYFPVDDIDAELARAEKLGGRRVLEPTQTPVSRIAAFADPDGQRHRAAQRLTPDSAPRDRHSACSGGSDR